MEGARKFAFALDGLIRSRTKGHGGDEYARKCIEEIAESIEEIGKPARPVVDIRPTTVPTAADIVAVRHLLIRAAHGELQAGGQGVTRAIEYAAGAALIGAHIGDLCTALRLNEEPVREKVAALMRQEGT